MGAITGAQIRAARAILDWTIDDLRTRSKVSAMAIRAIERHDGPSLVEDAPERTREHRQGMRDASMKALVETLEKAGVRFSNDGATVGVSRRLKK